MTTETEGAPSPGYHLWKAALRWKAAVKAALEPTGLTPTQFFALGAVGWATKGGGAAPSQRKVAQFAGLDLMTASQVLRALEGAKLVRREDDPADARSWCVSLTGDGRQALKKSAALVRAADEAFFGRLGARRETTVAALALLNTGATETDDDESPTRTAKARRKS